MLATAAPAFHAPGQAWQIQSACSVQRTRPRRFRRASHEQHQHPTRRSNEARSAEAHAPRCSGGASRTGFSPLNLECRCDGGDDSRGPEHHASKQ